MNRQEFETWKAGIYESINEAEGIIGLSQISKGGVGTHNNRTPAEIKKVNDRRDELKQRVADKMKKAGEVVNKSVKAGVDAVKNTAHDAGKVVAGAKKVLANGAKKVGNALSPKDDTPIGLAGLKRKAEEAKNKAAKSKSNDTPIGLSSFKKTEDSKKPDAPQKKPDPVNSLKTAPTGKSNSKQQGKSQSTTGKATTNTKVDDNKDNDTKDNNSNRKGIAQKLKDGAKKLAHGAFNTYYGAKYTAQDAKDWLKKAAKHAQVNQAHKRGHDRAHYEKDEDNTKSSNSNNSTNNSNASTNNTKATQSNTTGKSGNGGTNIHIHVTNGKGSSKDDSEPKKTAKATYDTDLHQARNDEDKRRRAEEESKMEEERENFFKKANGQKVTPSAKSDDSKGEEETKQTADTAKEVAKEVKKATSKKPKAPKKVGKEEEVKDNAEGELKNKAETAKAKTEETKVEEKKSRKAKVKSEVSPKAKTEEIKPEEKKEEVNAEETKAEPEMKEQPKEEKKPEVKPAEEKKDTKPEVKEQPKEEKAEEKKPEVKAETKTEEKKETPKIKANPNASNYRKLTDDEIQKSKAKELPKGEDRGSNTLQHKKTSGDEGSMYDDEKGNPVPAKPSDVKKDDSGERTERKAYIVKKAGEKKAEVKEQPKTEVKAEEKKPEVKPADEKKPEVKTEEKKEVKPSEEKKEETKTEEQKPSLADKVKSAKEKATQPKKELTPEEKKERQERLERLRLKQSQESQERFKKRQAEMADKKAGGEKSDKEIEANNEKIRKERGITDPDEDVKKQAETVSSSWRTSFNDKAHKEDYKDLPDEVSGHMKKYKDYWKRVNAKDHSMTDDERREGDELENKLKELMGKHPDAFGKKTTVKDKKEDEVKTHKPKKIDLSSKVKKAKEGNEKSDVDKFIEDTTGDYDGPSDAELKAIERAEKHAKKKK